MEIRSRLGTYLLIAFASLAGCGGDDSAGADDAALTYTLSVSVHGLNGTLVVHAGDEDLTVDVDGTHAFTTPFAAGTPYAVTLVTTPTAQACTVVAGAGTLEGNVTVDIPCVNVPRLDARALPRQVTLTWNDTGATSYDLYASSSATCDLAQFASCPDGAMITSATSPHTLAGLANGRNYTFWLVAHHADGLMTTAQSGARPDQLATDAPVAAFASDANGRMYLGGSFARVGARTGNGIALRTTSVGTHAFPLVDAPVNAAVPDGAGGWFIGGQFAQVGGVPRDHLAHILADGSVDAWNPGADGEVHDLAISGTTLYVAGEFTVIGGEVRPFLAAVATFGTTHNLSPWDPSAPSPVYAIDLVGTTLYIGGEFTAIAGEMRPHLAAIDTTQVANNLLPWNPGANSAVRELVANGSTIYIAGGFDTVGALPRARVAAIDLDGTPTSWAPDPDSTVYAIAVVGSHVVLGGSFAGVGGIMCPFLCAVSATDPTEHAAFPQVYGDVYNIATRADAIFIAGVFDQVNSEPRGRLAALSPTGELLPWAPSVEGTPYSLAASDDAVYLGGLFTGLDTVERTALAAIEADGTLAAWNPGCDGDVAALAVNGTTVYAGGTFEHAGGAERANLVALDASGVATAWSPRITGTVLAMALADTQLQLGARLYIGGAFTAVDDVARANIALLDTTVTTNPLRAWNPGASAGVYTLVRNSTVLYAGGAFTTIGGVTRNRLASFDTSAEATTPTAFNPGVAGQVLSLALVGRTLYVGGVFTSIGGATRANIAALSTQASSNNALSWNPGANDLVRAVVYDSSTSTLYAGGEFTVIGGASRNGLAALSSMQDTNSAAAWERNVQGYVTTLALVGGVLHVGGDFATIAGSPAVNYDALVP